MSRSARIEAYREHIAGEQWAEIRKSSMLATDGMCGFCGRPSTQVHHVKYPKKFTDDGPHNTVPVCDRCHALAHGGVSMHLVAVHDWHKEISPVGADFQYAIINDAPYATTEAWCAALDFPIAAQFALHVEQACRHIEARDKQARAQDKNTGAILVRWKVIDEALRIVDRKYHGKKLPPLTIAVGNVRVEAWSRWMEKYEMLRDWASDLQERALAAKTRAVVNAGTALTASEHIAAALSMMHRTVSEHGEIIAVHESEIGLLKEHIRKDPSEFLAATVFCQEIKVEPNMLPIQGDGRNLAELLGQVCRKNGATPGPEFEARLSGNNLRRPVKTWRRADLDAAYAAITKRVRDA